MNKLLSYHLPDEAATIRLGNALSAVLTPGLTLHLSGNLGAGKTTLVRAMLRALGVTGAIKSPTYSLMEVYVVSKFNIYHLDFYRFQSENEWEAFGLRDLATQDAILMIEWPEMAGVTLPAPDILLSLAPEKEGRQINMSARTEKGYQQLQRINYAE